MEKVPPPMDYNAPDLKTEDTEKNDDKTDPVHGRGTCVKDTIEDAALNTGAHGIANIYRHPAIWRKVFWLILFLGGLAIMLWQVSVAIMTYLKYPTTTSIEYDYSSRMRFPAVTLCNNNPYMLSKLRNYSDNSFYSYLETEYNTWNYFWDDDNASMPTEFDTWEDYGSDHEYSYDGDFDYGDYDDDYTYYDGPENEAFDFLEDFLSIMSYERRDVRKSLGYQMQDLLIDCTWQGKDCRLSQFYQFHNYLYGNCFTFNSGRGARVLETSKEGPLYAFALSLFIDQDEYVPGIADGAGVRVIIHNQNEMPLPDEQGFNVKPGTKTSIGLKKKVIHRLEPPHGKCKKYENYENKLNNAYLNDFDGIGYSVPVCKRTCFQRALLKKCECFDYRVPADSALEAYRDISGDLTQYNCYADDLSYTSCLRDTSLDYLHNKLGCREKCKEKCDEIQYVTSLSSMDWPSVAQTDKVLSELATTSDRFWNIITNDTWTTNDRKLWVRENFLKLEVYFEAFNYEVIKTQPSYELFTLISDFGGQVGLWLGLSMISIFEAVELIADLIVIGVRKAKAKAKAHGEKRAGLGETSSLGAPMRNNGDKWAVPSRECSGVGVSKA